MIVSSPRLSNGGHRMRPRVSRLTRVTILLVCAFLIPPNVSVGQKVYWSGYSVFLEDGSIRYRGYIQRANFDGSEVESLEIDGLQQPMRVALDTARGRLYWADERARIIGTANLDGSEARPFILLDYSPAYALAVNHSTGDLYWGEVSRIWRVAFDGEQPVLVVERLNRPPYPVGIDPAQGMVYWEDGVVQSLRRADVNGGSEEAVPIDATQLNDFVLDDGNGLLYWTSNGAVLSALIDDWAPTPVLPETVVGALRIGVAPESQLLFWIASGDVRACELTGQDCWLVQNAPFAVRSIAIDDRVSLDCDQSRLLGAFDIEPFVGCLTGPTAFADFSCLCADENGDRRVDLLDIGALQRQFRQKS